MKKIFAAVLLVMSFASIALADGSGPPPPPTGTSTPPVKPAFSLTIR